jgi:hypothetical protein
VANEVGSVAALLVDESDHVPDQMFDGVTVDAVGLLRPIVPSEVGRDDAIARLDEGWNLVAPGVPELREAVYQNHEVAVIGTGGDVVQSYVVDDGVVMFQVDIGE